MTADQIKQLFGSPISQKQKLPFEWTTAKKVVAAIIGFLTLYGAYALYRNAAGAIKKLQNKDK